MNSDELQDDQQQPIQRLDVPRGGLLAAFRDHDSDDQSLDQSLDIPARIQHRKSRLSSIAESLTRIPPRDGSEPLADRRPKDRAIGRQLVSHLLDNCALIRLPEIEIDVERLAVLPQDDSLIV